MAEKATLCAQELKECVQELKDVLGVEGLVARLQQLEQREKVHVAAAERLRAQVEFLQLQNTRLQETFTNAMRQGEQVAIKIEEENTPPINCSLRPTQGDSMPDYVQGVCTESTSCPAASTVGAPTKKRRLRRDRDHRELAAASDRDRPDRFEARLTNRWLDGACCMDVAKLLQGFGGPLESRTLGKRPQHVEKFEHGRSLMTLRLRVLWSAAIIPTHLLVRTSP